jgi:hypothetical protein
VQTRSAHISSALASHLNGIDNRDIDVESALVAKDADHSKLPVSRVASMSWSVDERLDPRDQSAQRSG